ncbi:MAG TPA: hypothetical protein VEY31_04525 [Roseococcus sp.]|nr:hypothetical protein [Roseococcus sp.]
MVLAGGAEAQDAGLRAACLGEQREAEALAAAAERWQQTMARHYAPLSGGTAPQMATQRHLREELERAALANETMRRAAAAHAMQMRACPAR